MTGGSFQVAHPIGTQDAIGAEKTGDLSPFFESGLGELKLAMCSKV